MNRSFFTFGCGSKYLEGIFWEIRVWLSMNRGHLNPNGCRCWRYGPSVSQQQRSYIELPNFCHFRIFFMYSLHQMCVCVIVAWHPKSKISTREGWTVYFAGYIVAAYGKTRWWLKIELNCHDYDNTLQSEHLRCENICNFCNSGMTSFFFWNKEIPTCFPPNSSKSLGR